MRPVVPLVSGRVLDEAGVPLGGAQVFFATGPVSLPDVAALTREDGLFALGAPAPGEYRLAARGKGGVSDVVVHVGPGDVTGLELRLGGPGALPSWEQGGAP